MMKKEQLKLYAVSDRSWLAPGETLASVTGTLLRAGVTCVQLREKNQSDEEIIAQANALLPLCRAYGVPLIINDRPDIAKIVGADGVHVGLEDMGIEKAREMLGSDFLIGGSAHNVAEAQQAQAAGADYLGCGAVFGSTTKTNVTTLSVEELRAICDAVDIPVCAIGGVTLDNIDQLAGSHIDGVAVVSALYAAEDKPSAVRQLLKKIETL